MRRSSTANEIDRRSALYFGLGLIKSIADEIQAAGGEVRYMPLDVTQKEQLVEFLQFAQAEFGRVDVLGSNAGIMPLSLLEQLKVEEWDKTIDVNLKGVLYGIAAALPIFKAHNSGHFINITSVADRWVGPTSKVYSATKHPVRVVSEGLRQETDSTIRVTIVAPGSTESELPNAISDPEIKQTVIERFRVLTRYLAKELGSRQIAVNTVAPGAILLWERLRQRN